LIRCGHGAWLLMDGRRGERTAVRRLASMISARVESGQVRGAPPPIDAGLLTRAPAPSRIPTVGPRREASRDRSGRGAGIPTASCAATSTSRGEADDRFAMADAPRVWFITTCMGRLAALRRSLPTLCGQPNSRVVVVDYSCPEQAGAWVETH